MTSRERDRLIDALYGVLPLPADCPHCDPSGGCPNPLDCRTELAERVVDVVERERAWTRSKWEMLP